MKFEFKPSFDRSLKSLSSKTKKEIKELCIGLIDILSGESSLPIEFILAGNHNDIKRFLKKN